MTHKTWFGLAMLAVGLEAAVIVAWVLGGAHMVTQHQVSATVQEEDEFGDTIERRVMTDAFQFGMLPDRPWDGALTWIVLLGGVQAGALVMWSKGRKAQA